MAKINRNLTFWDDLTGKFKEIKQAPKSTFIVCLLKDIFSKHFWTWVANKDKEFSTFPLLM